MKSKKNKNGMIRQALTVFLKEVKCIRRDKKTFIFSVIIPIIIFPLLLYVLTSSISNMEKQVSNKISVSLSNKSNYLYSYFSNFPDINILDTNDSKKELEKGTILANIIIPDNFNEMVDSGQNVNILLEVNQSSLKSQIALSKISEYVKLYNKTNAEFVLLKKGISTQVLNQINLKVENVSSQTQGAQSVYFNLIIPMLLVVYCCIGSASTATDLSAGEKERNTLEPLLSTSANRTSIIIGKIAATALLGIISGCSSVIGITGFIRIFQKEESFTLSFWQFISVIVIVILISMMFASINLSIGIYSRTYKEAQTYMAPLSILCIIPTYLAYAIDASDITLMHMSVPILNIVCIIKEILSGIFNFPHFIVLVFWLIVYISISYLLTIRLFKKEKIIFRL